MSSSAAHSQSLLNCYLLFCSVNSSHKNTYGVINTTNSDNTGDEDQTDTYFMATVAIPDLKSHVSYMM